MNRVGFPLPASLAAVLMGICRRALCNLKEMCGKDLLVKALNEASAELQLLNRRCAMLVTEHVSSFCMGVILICS